MSKTRRALAAAAFVSLAMLGTAACGGSKDAGEKLTAEQKQKAEDQKTLNSLAEAVNVAEGERIEPGSVESKTVEGLGDDCAKAIEPVRELMKKYKSGLLVPADDQTIANTMKAANPDSGGKCSVKEFADWYANEFNGWNNAVAK